MENERPVIYQKYFHRLEYLQKQWGWFLAFGLLLMLLGVISIAYSTYVTKFSMVFLGAFLLAGGILQIGYAFWAKEWSGFFLSLITGILYAVVGLLLLSNPMAGAIGLTLLLSGFYIVDGIFRIIGSAMMRFDQWGWSLFSGIVKGSAWTPHYRRLAVHRALGIWFIYRYRSAHLWLVLGDTLPIGA